MISLIEISFEGFYLMTTARSLACFQVNPRKSCTADDIKWIQNCQKKGGEGTSSTIGSRMHGPRSLHRVQYSFALDPNVSAAASDLKVDLFLVVIAVCLARFSALLMIVDL